MSDPHRREFLAAAAAVTTLATLAGTNQAAAGDPSFMNNVPDPALVRQGTADLQVRAGESQGKVIGDSFGKEATVAQLPISKGIAGVSMTLEPGAMRELHWHATAAEWAFVLEGRVRTTVIDPQGARRDQRLRARRRLVLPARPRPHAAMPGRRAVPLHPDLRQRLLLRVRHLQHHRLDRPRAKAAAGEELRPAGIRVRRLPEGGSLFRARQDSAGDAERAAAGPQAAAANAQVPHARAAAVGDL